MYDSKTIPKVVIKEDSRNNVDIQKITYGPNEIYFLYLNGRQENTLNVKQNKQVKEQYSSYDLAYGNVLCSGLGFGVLPLWIAKKSEVKSVKIIEISQDIIDIFLENNELPKNVTIECADMETYKTDEQYDCLLLDHYEGNANNWKIRSIQNITKNIPNHNLLWFWSIEDVYVQKCFNIIAEVNNPDFFQNEKDFSSKWKTFKKDILKVETIPNLNEEKINEYIYTYIDFLNSKYVLLKKQKD